MRASVRVGWRAERHGTYTYLMRNMCVLRLVIYFYHNNNGTDID